MEPFKIAIVDDEIHALHHLRRLLQAADGFEVVAAETDACEALHKLLQTDVDILFVDIMMPAMNGLDFARSYLHSKPNTTVIILTAYKDFDFAKQAVGIGVYDYWVKHELRPSTIAEKMEEVKEAVSKKRDLRERIDRQGVLEALSGQLPLSELFEQEDSHGPCFLIYLKSADSGAPADLVEFYQEFKAFSEKFEVRITRFAVLVGTAAAVGRLKSRRRFPEFCGALPAFCAGKSRLLALSDPLLPDDYDPKIHQRHLSAFQNLYFAPGQYFRRLSAASLDLLIPQNPMLLQFEKKYFEAAGAHAQALEGPPLIELVRRVWRDPLITEGNLQAVRHACVRLWEIGGLLSAPPEGEPQSMPERMGPGEMERFFIGWYQNSFLLLETGQADQTRKVKQIAAYIQKNYSGDLRLQTLTRRFNISPDYLRKLFKTETGQNLSEFITNVRIERSKQLLRTGQYKIYEVAELVGYHSAQYFSQAFYKATGAYPTDHAFGRGNRDEEDVNPH